MKSFSLIETLVVIAVFSFVIVAVCGLVVMSYRTHSYTSQQSSAIEGARRGLEIMIKEIREAKNGEDGSYPIEKADDKEFIFYSDIDKDDRIERVRYFLGAVFSKKEIKECVNYIRGGSCSVTFSNFLSGEIKSAQIKVSVEGDFGSSNEYAEIYADGVKLDNLCQTGCQDCAGAWQGTSIFEVKSQVEDNVLQMVADACSKVDPVCSWENPNHSIKAIFELSWTEEIPELEQELKKGVIQPTDNPANPYPLEEEEVSTITSFVRNAPPIFEYFDKNGQKLTGYPARLSETTLLRIYLIVNVDPNRPPTEFELESSVRLRNLTKE